jgi:endonuclease/exonuclease/phosphatase family metal-dependent hydrolase/Tfp pilus assembly protein PilV
VSNHTARPTARSTAQATARPTVSSHAARWRLALILALLVVTLLSAAPTQADAYSMKAPSGLKAIAATSTTLTLTWNPVSKAEMYRVQYSTSKSMSKAKYDREDDAKDTLTGLTPGKTYYVKVRVIDADGDNRSSYSSAVKIAIPTKDPTPTPSPTPTPTPTPAAGPLRVASYNIKCANCDSNLPNEGSWAERRQAVVDTILGQHLDVVGLQEAGQSWLKDEDGHSIDPSLTQFEDLTNRLGGSWTLTNKNRNNCVRSTTPSSCVYKDQGASQDTKIIFDASRVQLLDQGSKKLSFADPDDNPRYVAWAQLRQRSTGNRFMFATTHLEGTKDEAGSTTFFELRRTQTAGDLRRRLQLDPVQARLQPEQRPVRRPPQGRPGRPDRLRLRDDEDRTRRDRGQAHQHLGRQLQRVQPRGEQPQGLDQRGQHRLHVRLAERQGARVGDRGRHGLLRTVRRHHPVGPQHDQGLARPAEDQLIPDRQDGARRPRPVAPVSSSECARRHRCGRARCCPGGG